MILMNGSDATTDHAAAAGDEENDLRCQRNRDHDAFGVIRIGVPELHEVVVGYGVHEPESREARTLETLRTPWILAAALGESTHAFFLDGGKAASKVAGGN